MNKTGQFIKRINHFIHGCFRLYSKMSRAMGSNAMNDIGVNLPLFQFFNDNSAMIVWIFFPICIMEHTSKPPFTCLQFGKIFLFQSPCFHNSSYLFHMQTQSFVLYLLVELLLP